MMRSLHVAVALMLMPAALAQHPVMEIKVAGNERLAAAAVIAASGLRKGQTATRAELDAAAQKLADTGFFTRVSYRYEPTALAPVELDIPGQDAEHLWQQLKTADGFMDRQMPNNDRASAYYKRAIE